MFSNVIFKMATILKCNFRKCSLKFKIHDSFRSKNYSKMNLETYLLSKSADLTSYVIASITAQDIHQYGWQDGRHVEIRFSLISVQILTKLILL